MRLIDADELKKAIEQMREDYIEDNFFWTKLFNAIDNAPTVEQKYYERVIAQINPVIEARPQGYVDISKLRLMKVEECAGHTIDYAMGWKACIEWIKKGGAE